MLQFEIYKAFGRNGTKYNYRLVRKTARLRVILMRGTARARNPKAVINRLQKALGTDLPVVAVERRGGNNKAA